MADVADHFCWLRSVYTETTNHSLALRLLNTGSQFASAPSLGAVCSRLLSQKKLDIPPYVVLLDATNPCLDATNWSAASLDPVFAGLPYDINSHFKVAFPRRFDACCPSLGEAPLQARGAVNNELTDPASGSRAGEAASLATQWLNVLDELSRSIEQEPSYVQMQYGLDRAHTAPFGRQFLLARRLLEKGSTFVQIYISGWDAHSDLKATYTRLLRSVDRPFTAFIKDLHQRGLLSETLLICAGEFGRSPYTTNVSDRNKPGRDHQAQLLPVWLTGPGIRTGRYVGHTDELGLTCTSCPISIHDLHTTLLALLEAPKSLPTDPSWQEQTSYLRRGRLLHELLA